MRLKPMTTLMVIAEAATHAGSAPPASDRTLTVCMEGAAGFGVAGEAQVLSSKMFAGISLRSSGVAGFRAAPSRAS